MLASSPASAFQADEAYPQPEAAAGGLSYDSTYMSPDEVVKRVRVRTNGRAAGPLAMPAQVRMIMKAGNKIATTPYVWGGGHGSFTSSGYDCSGSVSYALHGAKLLDVPESSGPLESYGEAGPGKFVTIYANAGHAFMVVAGLRFDTSAHGPNGSRWTAAPRDLSGYVARHPAGL